MPECVMIAMSGGVDSTVAALLLKEAGYGVTGVTLRLWPQGADQCVRAARRAASLIGIPHEVLDLSREFAREVVDRFADGYLDGLTPNPCIFCNQSIKFGRLYETAMRDGFDYLATGHYARIISGGLYKAVDITKDQSYVLYTLTREQLTRLKLPLGALTKREVRELAQRYGLVSPDSRESQDICFIPDGDYAAFIARYRGVPRVPGDFIDTSGRVLGKHRGVTGYTAGQRRGLGVSADTRLYVIRKDMVQNTVTLGEERELYTGRIMARHVNIISEVPEAFPRRAEIKLRYGSGICTGVVDITNDRRAHILFDTPQRAPAAGQSAVFYDGDAVLGGGVIE